jgi:hypothetical protein
MPLFAAASDGFLVGPLDFAVTALSPFENFVWLYYPINTYVRLTEGLSKNIPPNL